MSSFYKFNKSIDYFKKIYTRLNFIPNSKLKIVNNDFFIWEYKYTSKSSLNYTICLNHERYWTPRTWIVEPDFTNGYFPHVYKQQRNRLCLFHERDFTWSSDKDIIQTIICWSCLWIEYYEIYKILGKWVGPEAEHDNIEKNIQDRLCSYNVCSKEEILPKYLKDYPIRI